MGAQNTTFENIEIEVPTVTYIRDDNGYRGEATHRRLKIGRVSVSGCEDLPNQLMLELEKREDAREALTEASNRKGKYACPLVRLASLKIWEAQGSERILVAKAGYFYAVRERTLECFWCSHKENVADGGKLLRSKTNLYHENCNYSKHMKDEAGKLSCIDQSENIDRLCKKMECPLCRWDQ